MKTSHRTTKGFVRLWTTKRALNTGLAVLAGASLLVGASIGFTQTLPPNPLPTVVVPPPQFASWFTAGFVTVNGPVDPADSLNFTPGSIGDFYKWSWQMFLWLLSPATGGYGSTGLIFTSPVFFGVTPMDAVGNRHFYVTNSGFNGHRTMTRLKPNEPFNVGVRVAALGPHSLPVVITTTGKVYEVAPQRKAADGLPIVNDANGNQVEVSRVTIGDDKQPIYWDTKSRAIKGPRASIDLESLTKPKTGIGAPDLSKLVVKFTTGDNHSFFLGPVGTLLDVEVNQADNGVLMSQAGSLVYYASFVNDVYAYFLTGTKDGGIPATPANSVVVGGVTIFRFPTDIVGLTEVTNFATANGFTIVDPKALAVELKTSWVDASTVSNPSNYVIVPAKVPVYDMSNPLQWKPIGAKVMKLALVGMHVVGSTKGHPEMLWATFEHFDNTPNAPYMYIDNLGATVPGPVSPGPWMFSSLPGGPFNQKHMSYDALTGNINALPGFTVSPSDTQRIHPFGMLPTNAASNSDIISVDDSVLTQLLPGDIRANYYMIGTTWTAGGLPPNGTNEVGTNILSNSTLETYQQNINCFACHQSTFGSPVSTTDISHIFGPLLPLF
ncbi:MAG TPA: hypothetical protein VHE55_09005 [Fimbriimonadaceae bacterium]|nr:hypothetical protein [Fimbriimonadaceae bacterium]